MLPATDTCCQQLANFVIDKYVAAIRATCILFLLEQIAFYVCQMITREVDDDHEIIVSNADFNDDDHEMTVNKKDLEDEDDKIIPRQNGCE